LIDVVAQEKEQNSPATVLQSKTNPLQNFTDGLNTLRSSSFKTLLSSFVTDANGDYDKLKTNIENWYNEYMDRVSSWYKKRIHKALLVLGFLLAVLMNVDTIRISKTLWENTVLRESVVNAAQNFSASNKNGLQNQSDTTFDSRVENIKSGYDKLGMLNLPIGWGLMQAEKNYLAEKYNHQHVFKNYWEQISIFFGRIGLSTLLGWIFTGVAVSFGAPMWFDMLNKLINLRQSIKGSSEKN